MEQVTKWNLEEKDLEQIKEVLKTNKLIESDFMGSVEIGELSIEFVFRDYDSLLILDYDVFVGGVDSGYGYTTKKLPYDYASGGKLLDLDTINKITSFDNFKSYILKEVMEFINRSYYNVEGIRLIDKFNSQKFFDWN